MIQQNSGEGDEAFYKRLLNKFPKDSIKAILINKDSHRSNVNLSYTRGFSGATNNISIFLDSDQGIPTDEEFDKVRITSQAELKNVSVTWRNFYH